MINYYKILGLHEKATSEEIKKAYKHLAVQYHPDKNKDINAINMFKDISEAYQVLSDQHKRSEYDQMLHHKVPDNFKEFKFVYQDPMKIFAEVFSFMNDMQMMFNMMDSMMVQMQHIPVQNIIQMHQLPGMAVHIIDLTHPILVQQQLQQNLQKHLQPKQNHIKIEEVPNKGNPEPQLLLENRKEVPEHNIHIIEDKKLDEIINNTLKQQL